MLKKIMLVAFVGAASLVSFKMGQRGAEVSVPSKALADGPCDLGPPECCDEYDPCSDHVLQYYCTQC